ncbi:hypothetical protein [Candidatus Rhabdochlamydia porcellionis]|nr:hypothetical protein [Candidatus Rhabdochlamydia porcellionis]
MEEIFFNGESQEGNLGLDGALFSATIGSSLLPMLKLRFITL